MSAASLRAFVLAAIAALALAALTACTPLAFVNGLVPEDTFRRHLGIAYGDHDRQKLDVYVPRAGAASAPVVVFFYGGSWTNGSRGDYLFVGEALASQGFVAVVADYRLYPEVRFPAFVDDAALAVRWARDNANRYGGNAERLFVMGHSAGAYNAAMVAYNPAYLETAGVSPQVVKGFIGLAGPYDFLPLTGRLLRAVFGYPNTSPDTQPVNFVASGAPPALLLTATRDGVVNPGNSARLAARIRTVGGSAREVSYDELDHRTIVGALAAPLRQIAPVLPEISAFVREHTH